MKKVYVFLLLAFVFLLSSCTTYDESTVLDSVDYRLSNMYHEAFASYYYWDGTEEWLSIVIPDEVDDYKVTSLGGFYGTGYPMPFMIEFPESYQIEGIWAHPSEMTYPNEYVMNKLTFHVTLGAHVKEAKKTIENGVYYSVSEDSSDMLYEVYYYLKSQRIIHISMRKMANFIL